MTFSIELKDNTKPSIVERTVINHTLYLMCMEDPSPFPIVIKRLMWMGRGQSRSLNTPALREAIDFVAQRLTSDWGESVKTRPTFMLRLLMLIHLLWPPTLQLGEIRASVAFKTTLQSVWRVIGDLENLVRYDLMKSLPNILENHATSKSRCSGGFDKSALTPVYSWRTNWQDSPKRRERLLSILTGGLPSSARLMENHSD